MVSIISIYLFDEEAEMLDRIDKLSNIVFAFSTFVLTIWIFYKTIRREDKKDETVTKLEFLKSLLLESNSEHFYKFYENVLSKFHEYDNTISDESKTDIIDYLIEEHKFYRLKFYDLILPFDKDVYNYFKKSTDKLIDEISELIIVNQSPNSSLNSTLEKKILKYRTDALKNIININNKKGS